ncbi:endonuclease/exonuclease/phosphatase family protein [uncultured Brevundimonas sp.]|uniref:endonuclease/exonuclease/phosphatase family protein n=1 Tax=uncultured Brevundimonas sp. TaxID=213418 RepID=UPI00260751FF|nr:endonuclease/exonuclease/phosphatase family protein [uncultured Brevundimonas sp.]
MPRLLTYNVHRCVGTDRKLDVERIARVIAAERPDIVCLQEIDVGRARTDGVDQAARLAELLGMSSRFHPAMQREDEQYGDAILTRYPDTLRRTGSLPTVSGIRGLESRGAVWTEIDIDGVGLNVLNTHFGLVPAEQRRQAAALVGKDWLGACKGPTILAGDFNATSITRPYGSLTRHLRDAQRVLGLKPSVKTFPSAYPAIRIDHLFVSSHIAVERVFTGNSPEVRTASDHVPLVMDFAIRP